MKKHTLIAEPGSNAFTLTRTFDAPRELVFKTMTDPKLIPQWWGPKDYTTVVATMDVRPGGGWRFVQKGPDGSEYGFFGFFHQIEAPSRVVQTFEFEGMPGHVLMETMILEERDGKTLFTDISVFQTVEDRDGMIASGMEHGFSDSMEQLEALIEAARVAR
ncbi:MAG: SRPBCC family protein [Anaerolineae bacterium]|nr:SRPBCC family protein [Anaerolineae bacterium]